MKKYLFVTLLVLLCSTVRVWGVSPVTVIESQGWQESLWVKWQAVENAKTYDVYYSDDANAQIKIDDRLIRGYEGYFRADIPGLKAGKYNVTIVPVFEDGEGEGITINALQVTAHDRSGFAFSANSQMKSGSGAYNDDGTLKSNAQVIYITPKNGSTVKGYVTTDKGREERTGIVEILQGREKGKDQTPLAVRFIGNISAASLGSLSSGDLLEIKGKDYSEMNITFEGIGDDAVANGWGMLVNKTANVEVRNMAFMNFPDDGVSIKSSENIWVHNNDFFYGKNKGGDQEKGDGSLDVKDDSKYTTFSYNHFWDSGKASLCGMKSETGANYLTYHHNWFDHSDSRHPRVRRMSVHVYNNYYDGVAKYGVGATTGASVFVENNYFRNCKYPMLISKQGTDVYYDAKGTFSGEDGGIIKAYGNHIEGARRFVDQLGDATNFDAISTSSRDEQVGDTYKTVLGGHVYDNFDTDPAIMYTYTVDAPAAAKDNVTKWAGRTNGGDLKFAFGESDDASSDVKQEISAALLAYKSGLVSIQGEEGGGDDGGDGGDDGGDDGKEDPADMVHNFTVDGLTSTYFTISGNLSTSKGTVVYKGLTLTQCLKLESATSVSFTTSQEATLILVFNDDFSGKVKINDVAHNASGGKLEITLPAGSQKITKGDSANLYYMSVTYTADPQDIDTSASASFNLYVDKAGNTLYIQNDTAPESVKLYSLSGSQLVHLQAGAECVDISRLHAGTYVVKVRCKGKEYNRVIVKRK